MLDKHKIFYLYLCAVILNIIISYSLLLYRQPVSIDGILYLHAAEVYTKQGLHAAMVVYPWPFYSVLIAKISQFSSLSLFFSAYLLDVVLTSLLVCFFLKVISACGGVFTHQCWGLALILLYPFLNHERINILRDFGYYAFFMVSFWYFIKFLEKNKLFYALCWQIAMLIAATFRIEGILLLFFIPLIILILPYNNNTFRERGLDYIKLTSISILLIIIAGCLFPGFLHFGRIAEIINNLQMHKMIIFFQEKILILREQVLGILARDGALWFLIGGIAGVFLAAILSTLGIFSAVLLIYGIYKKNIAIKSFAKQGIFIYSVSILLVLTGFLLHQLFLSERYVMPFVLLLMLLLVFVIKALYSSTQLKFKILIIIFLLFNMISSFGHFGPSKSYIIDAGEWAKKNIPANSIVYINDAQIAYYADRRDTQTALILDQLKNYQYMIINIKRNEKSFTEQQLIQTIGKPPIEVFQNKRGDKAVIFN